MNSTKQLMKIALRYVDKGYTCEQLMDGDDLYSATPEEREECSEYWSECRSIGFKAFQEKIDNMN